MKRREDVGREGKVDEELGKEGKGERRKGEGEKMGKINRKDENEGAGKTTIDKDVKRDNVKRERKK